MSKKPLGGITVPDDSDEIMRRLSSQAENMPSLTKGASLAKAEPAAARMTPRSTKTVSLPSYAWASIRERGYESGEPMNVVIMRGLKSIGIDIRDEDLVDGRTRR